MAERFDVAILGGGPAGSTCGALLKKFNPDLRVVILEKAVFPREHVGESQLPAINFVLHEMGVWEKVEAAGFPVKLGATYRWGNSDKLWDFSFLGVEEFAEHVRPAPFRGQRRRTAFHVDRAVYDDILLRHAAELGCEVRQGESARVTRVGREANRVTGLALGEGGEVEATHYVDASGESGLIRRAMGVTAEYPAKLKNIAIWDYWHGGQWAVRVGRDATRVLVMSIGPGWIWYIPLSDERISVGFVCAAEYFKGSGRSPEELYLWALPQDPLVRGLLSAARREGPVRATRDWSFVSDRLFGENWFLCGDAAGFADPILAAGLTLTHLSAREVAYAILELFRGELDPSWVRTRYEQVHRRRIHQHVRFADFWYDAKGEFPDLEAETSRIAASSGLKLDPKSAFRWLSNGGLSQDALGRADFGGLDLSVFKRAAEMMTGRDVEWAFSKHNVFRLNLKGAREEELPVLAEGRIRRQRCLVREDRTLPVAGYAALVLDALSRHSAIEEALEWMAGALRRRGVEGDLTTHLHEALQALEVMLADGWVWGQLNPGKPTVRMAPARAARESMVPDAPA